MKTIALLYDQVLDIGGVEQHLLGLLRCADSARFRFVFLSQTSPAFARQAEALGARVVPHARWRITDRGSIPQLAEALRAAGADLVHAHSPTAAAIVRLAARRLSLPALVTVHAPVFRYHGDLRTLRASTGRQVYIALDRWLNFTHPAPLVYVSQAVRDECVARRISPAGKSMVIPNGIDLARFACAEEKASLRRELGVETPDPLLIYTGRLSREKGVDVLLEAAAMLKDQGAALSLWLVGEGGERPALEAQVSRLGLEKCVRLWGWQAQVERFLCAADIFTLPSRSEALSVALLEALAAGLPVVVTQVGDSPHLAQGGAGLAIPPDDPAGLSQALRQLIDSPELRARMGAAARLCAAEFSLDKMAAQVQNQYARLLGMDI